MGVGGEREQARARLSTLRLFNNTKRGGVVFTGVKKIRGDGLVAWRGEVVAVAVVAVEVAVGGGTTSLTPHHLLPGLSQDRGRARSVGWRI